MAEADGTIADLYPPPPPYYEFFTEENVKKVNEWIKENEKEEAQVPKDKPSNGEEEASAAADGVRKVPEGELQFLIPPERPSGQTYRVFGNIWQFDDKMPSLKEVGIEQLYEDRTAEDALDCGSEARIEELKKLFKSLLLNFLELIGIMGKNPTVYPKKLEQIRIIMINIHHLLNEYRPHQARESLILLLQNQIGAKKNDIKRIESVTQEIRKELLPQLVAEIARAETSLRKKSGICGEKNDAADVVAVDVQDNQNVQDNSGGQDGSGRVKNEVAKTEAGADAGSEVGAVAMDTIEELVRGL